MHTALTLLCGGLLAAVTVAIEISTNNPVKVIIGETANLNVSFVSKNPPHVTWALSDTFASWTVGQVPPPMVSQVFVNRLTINTSTASIAILQTTLADSRNYTVSLTAVDELLSSQKVTLRVYELISEVLVTVPVDDVKEGDSKTTVICAMTTGTWDTLSWTKDGKTIVGDAHMVIASNELTIQGVVRGDAGTYSCSVKNPFSDGTSQNQLTVYCKYSTHSHLTWQSVRFLQGIFVDLSFRLPCSLSIRLCFTPSIPVPPAPRFVLVNSTVTLTCSTSSEPPAQYLWSVGESSDTNVPSNPVLIDDASNWTRLELQLHRYQCQAEPYGEEDADDHRVR
ncbi:hepatocyte cell adhesion molecule-like [Scyliorhinus canicula]|uniref:hepatocyte cell adhesion molecule-like n=1 Tax=Scyliorhinus canicula TaxID=7830 RepID=UPI0018F642FA|nr:hepatocyte cell adhesion molecule-like [Scyliorhinus canicula]